jgi:hypothetical protein
MTENITEVELLLTPDQRRVTRQDTTLGSSLFYDPLAGTATVSEIRQRLELKYCACLATGGTNGFPLDVRRIKTDRLRTLAACSMLLRNWSVNDLLEITGNMELVAGGVLLATLDQPRWGPEDLLLMGMIEAVEDMQSRALRGGRTL